MLLAALAWVFVQDADVKHVEDGAEAIRVEPEVSWSPDPPGEGRLFCIEVIPSALSPLLGVHGSFAGEELHFVRSAHGTFETWAAVPVGGADAESGALRIVYAAGGEERMTFEVPVAPGSYEHEELRVAPRFGSPLGAEDRARLERDRASAPEAARRAHRTPRIATDSVILPRNSRVTSGFGDGRIFNGQISSRHMGLDLRGAPGDTVLAAARGIVEVVAPFLLAGNVVYLNHGGGVVSGYFHLSRPLVEPEDTVDAGQPIGLVGATGRVTGPHLHWVVRYGSISVDPLSLLDLQRD
ncbi:MAG: M23 family metallopeptidase [Longimicrobiales bacterium]|nr:M23 family metallopeptidase [Longimicrobiales bacterium]